MSGQFPRWLADAGTSGRINPAFTSEYAHSSTLFPAQQTITNGVPHFLDESPTSPPSHVSSNKPMRRRPPVPLCSSESHFTFPPPLHQQQHYQQQQHFITEQNSGTTASIGGTVGIGRRKPPAPPPPQQQTSADEDVHEQQAHHQQMEQQQQQQSPSFLSPPLPAFPLAKPPITRRKLPAANPPPSESTATEDNIGATTEITTSAKSTASGKEGSSMEMVNY